MVLTGALEKLCRHCHDPRPLSAKRIRPPRGEHQGASIPPLVYWWYFRFRRSAACPLPRPHSAGLLIDLLCRPPPNTKRARSLYFTRVLIWNNNSFAVALVGKETSFCSRIPRLNNIIRRLILAQSVNRIESVIFVQGDQETKIALW